MQDIDRFAGSMLAKLPLQLQFIISLMSLVRIVNQILFAKTQLNTYEIKAVLRGIFSKTNSIVS